MGNINDVSYCVGMSIADSLIQQDLGDLSVDVLANAIKDIFEGKTPKFSNNEANNIIQGYVNEMGEKKFAVYKQEGEDFLAENKAKAGIFTTESGLQYEVLVQGEGKKPAATDTVKVHYHGTLIDGTVFDSSVARNQPATFGVHQVIAGWTEALQLMNAGSKFKLYIPQELAYGAHPHPGGAIKPYMALIFEVELIEVL